MSHHMAMKQVDYLFSSKLVLSNLKLGMAYRKEFLQTLFLYATFYFTFFHCRTFFHVGLQYDGIGVKLVQNRR